MAVTSEKEKATRVQMDLSPSSFERLNRLKEMVEAKTYTEVMKDALRLYEWIVQEESDGSDFLVKTKDGVLEKIKIFT
jgi:hypothetical protein